REDDMRTLVLLIAVALFASVGSAPVEDPNRWDVIKKANQRAREQEEQIGHRLKDGVILDAVIEGMQKVEGVDVGDGSNRREMVQEFLSNRGDGLGARLDGAENQRDAVINALSERGQERAEAEGATK
ncbi:hypothetical protein ACR2V2_25960, partial [Klebsiella pneumoniae]